MQTLAGTSPRRTSFLRSRRFIVGGLIVIAVLLAVFAVSRVVGNRSAPALATVPVKRGPITANVAGIGTTAAAQSLDLIFQATGTVKEVLVKEGDRVTGGQTLARLDDAALQAQLNNAEAALVAAQAKLTQTQQGDARPEDVAAARAQLSSAQASYAKLTAAPASSDVAAARAALASAQSAYDKLAAGPASPDLASAQATLRSAQASYDKALAPPTAADLGAAQASVQSAQSQLASAQQTLTQTKAKPRPEDVQTAQLNVQQAKNSLYSQQVTRDNTCGVTGANSNQCKSADAAVNAAATGVNSAVASLATASQPAKPEELAASEQAVKSAQAGLASAQANLAKVQAGPTAADKQSVQAQIDTARAGLARVQGSIGASDLAAAQAQVATAEQNLAKVENPNTANDLAVAQANVDLAQANLAKLTAPGTATDLAIAQASVTQAEQSLKQAQINLAGATLKAPFDGTVTAVNVVPGSSASGLGSGGSGGVVSNTGTGAAISVVDRGTMHIDLKLSENDVLKVVAGQPVALTNDSLASWAGKGTVSYVGDAGQTTNGVVTYPVRVTFSDPDPRLRVGMTLNVTITTAHKDDALLVPNASLLPKGSGHIVQELNADGRTTREVDVQTGLSDGTNTEITSGLKEGELIVAFPSGKAPPSAGGGGFFGG